jgi:hypothetical protein
MAVLVEGISVVVRSAAIELRFAGGVEGFLEAAAGPTFCADDELACVGFLATAEAEAFCEALAAAGLSFGGDDAPADVAVVDQFEGVVTDADWLEFARLDSDGAGHEIAACWLYEGPHTDDVIHLPSGELELSVPDGWTYAMSLSAAARFIPDDEIDERLEFVRHDASGREVYRDRTTGEELYAQDDPGAPEA